MTVFTSHDEDGTESDSTNSRSSSNDNNINNTNLPKENKTTTTTTTAIQIEQLASFRGRSVPLGNDFSVRRVLPHVKQRSVGPFVFLDHFGPVVMEDHAAMNEGPHPDIGLMTISYLYDGAILHRDSTGAEQIVLPGDVNAMISGKGITHSGRGALKDIVPHLESLNHQEKITPP